jgi:hypothetical protein
MKRAAKDKYTHNSLLKTLSYLFVIGKLASLQFRINQLAINADFETASVGRYQGQLAKAGLQFSDDLIGQTDRFRFVVSNLTVDDLDIHYQRCSF